VLDEHRAFAVSSAFVRPKNVVAGVALTVALALVALPGLAGSSTPRPIRPLDAAAFQTLSIKASDGGSSIAIDPLDAAYRSAGALQADSSFIEPPAGPIGPTGRPHVTPPAISAGVAIKPPRYSLRGVATFYDNGTTAMRLPRGTILRVCGPGGCLERTVTDYGPVAGTNRIIDLYRPDFFKICGCPSWSGTIWVTVGIY
jgi:hypothetical protein